MVLHLSILAAIWSPTLSQKKLINPSHLKTFDSKSFKFLKLHHLPSLEIKKLPHAHVENVQVDGKFGTYEDLWGLIFWDVYRIII